MWQKFHRLYVLADKLSFEELQNCVMDIQRELGKKKIVPTTYLKQLERELRPDCQLFRFWVAEYAYHLHSGKGFSPNPKHVIGEDTVLDWIERGGKAVREIFRLMVQNEALQTPETAPRCAWHIHERTPRCKDGR